MEVTAIKSRNGELRATIDGLRDELADLKAANEALEDDLEAAEADAAQAKAEAESVSSDASTEDKVATSTPAVSTNPVKPKPAKFRAEVVSFEAINPLTLRVSLRVENTGGKAARPSCLVNANDPSRSYDGSDIFFLKRTAPGATTSGYGDLTVENDHFFSADEPGAIHVTDVDVTC